METIIYKMERFIPFTMWHIKKTSRPKSTLPSLIVWHITWDLVIHNFSRFIFASRIASQKYASIIFYSIISAWAVKYCLEARCFGLGRNYFLSLKRAEFFSGMQEFNASSRSSRNAFLSRTNTSSLLSFPPEITSKNCGSQIHQEWFQRFFHWCIINNQSPEIVPIKLIKCLQLGHLLQSVFLFLESQGREHMLMNKPLLTISETPDIFQITVLDCIYLLEKTKNATLINNTCIVKCIIGIHSLIDLIINLFAGQLVRQGHKKGHKNHFHFSRWHWPNSYLISVYRKTFMKILFWL